VVLGKVIAAPKGGMLLESDLCSVVEYECASPADGLLGPMRPRLNPFYPKQGLQHLRVSDVKRDDILVYAVQCDFSGKGDERKIRIKHDYLHRLAAADATFSMPIAAARHAVSGNPRRSGSGGTSARRQPAVATPADEPETEGEEEDDTTASDKDEEIRQVAGLPTGERLAGRRVLVPREAWPSEPCEGEGWWGKVKRVVSGKAKVLMECLERSNTIGFFPCAPGGSAPVGSS